MKIGGNIEKSKKKLRNLVVPKPENHILTLNTLKRLKIISVERRGKKHSVFADTKLQTDQIKKKIVAKFNKPLFI